jgi:hypothetical protein
MEVTLGFECLQNKEAILEQLYGMKAALGSVPRSISDPITSNQGST